MKRRSRPKDPLSFPTRWYDSGLNFKFQKDGDGKTVVSYSPAQPTFNWPLKIKKKWHGRFSWSPRATDDPEYLDVSVGDKIETIAVMGREITAFKMIEYRL